MNLHATPARRLRQCLVRSYEVTLYALLLALGAAVALPAPEAEPGAGAGAAPQCGNIQSSALVITR